MVVAARGGSGGGPTYGVLLGSEKLERKTKTLESVSGLRPKLEVVRKVVLLPREVNNCPESFEYEIQLLSHGPLSLNEYSGCMVFYVPDLKLGKNWHVVLTNPLRKVFNVPVGDVYQDEEPQLNLNVDLNLEQSSLRRGSTPLELVDG
ncbi:hypothetical protein Tco_0563535 [Tanacetum coccineum]